MTMGAMMRTTSVLDGEIPAGHATRSWSAQCATCATTISVVGWSRCEGFAGFRDAGWSKTTRHGWRCYPCRHGHPRDERPAWALPRQLPLLGAEDTDTSGDLAA